MLPAAHAAAAGRTATNRNPCDVDGEITGPLEKKNFANGVPTVVGLGKSADCCREVIQPRAADRAREGHFGQNYARFAAAYVNFGCYLVHRHYFFRPIKGPPRLGKLTTCAVGGFQD